MLGTFGRVRMLYSRRTALVILLLAFLSLSLFLVGPAIADSPVPALGPVDGLDLPAEEPDRVATGDPAPDFVLEDVRGERVRLSGFRGQNPVVLVFYRGKW